MSKTRSSLGIGIINRYLFTETLTNFGICVLVFTLTALMSQIFNLTEMVVNKGLSLGDTFILILYFLPSLLFLVIPISLLMGILITLGRMSSDVEIIAYKASGIGLRQIFRPIFVVAFIAYLITTILTVYGSPQSTQALKRHLFDIARTKAEVGLKERIFNTDFSNIMIYVNEILPQTHRLRGVLISYTDPHQDEVPATIVAQEGYFVSKPDKLELKLYLTNGSIHSLDRDSNDYQEINFTQYTLNLDLQQQDPQEKKKKRKKEEILTHELLDQALVFFSEGRSDNAYALMVEFHSRLAIPFMCILFGLIGVPLGVYSPRTGRSYGFVVGLFVMLLYYILFSFGRNLGSTGVVPPSIAIWVPNLIFLALALYVFRKAASESPIYLLERLGRVMEFMRKKLILLTEGKQPVDPMVLTIIEDLNTNNEYALALKLGIDDAQAEKIVAYRQKRGGIKNIEELRNVPGIDEDTYSKIQENTMG